MKSSHSQNSTGTTPHICVLTTSYPRDSRDDAGIFVKNLVDAFSEIGLQGTVIVPQHDTEPASEKHAGFILKRYRYGMFSRGRLAFGAGIIPNLRKDPLLLFQIPGLLLMMALTAIGARSSKQVVHANWIPASLVAFFIHFLIRSPYVVTLRGEDMRILQRALLSYIFLVPLRCASAIVSVNESFLHTIKGKFKIKPERLHCIPNGVTIPSVEQEDLLDFLKRYGLEPKKKYILFVGTIIPRKRAHLLIELLNLVGMSEFELLLCGRTDNTDYFESVRETAKQLKVLERVHFCGKVAPQEIPYFMKAARYYVSASEFEGRSNSILEALAAGMVVIASDIEGHREVIQSSINGYIYTSENLADAANIIVECEANPVGADSIRRAARESVRTLSWIETAKCYSEVFSQVAATNER